MPSSDIVRLPTRNVTLQLPRRATRWPKQEITAPSKGVKAAVGSGCIASRRDHRIYRFIKRHEALAGVVGRLSESLTESSRSPAARLLAPLRQRLGARMTSSDVLMVVDHLQARGVELYIAGGWGVDALAGRETRPHNDLDVVLHRFDRDEPVASGVLNGLGFPVVERTHEGSWMPRRTWLDDKAGHRVDLVDLDWDRLRDALAPAEELTALVYTEGTIDGRVVPCLSAAVQRLCRRGYGPRPVDRHDLAVLDEVAGD